MANVSSLHRLHSDGFPTNFDKDVDRFFLSTPRNGVLAFNWDGEIEHYVCDFDCHVRNTERNGKALTTIAENMANYPVRLVKAAKDAPFGVASRLSKYW